MTTPGATMKDARRKQAEECYHCMDLGSFCKYHDYSKTIIESEVVRKFILSQDEPYDSDTLEIAVMHGIAHARRTQAAEIQKLKARLSNAIDDYIEMQNKISGMYSEKEVETRIAEAVKRERARILDVARNWTGCKYCSTGETLKELVHPAPSNEWDRDG